MRHSELQTILLLGMTIFGFTTRLHAQTGGEAVGNLSGQLTVSDMGAAVYSLTFDVPDGGPLTPQIGIAYNSQTAGYGLVGYGFNITGISCITRGGKDLFHDKTVQGVTYTDDDNYFLDGKRLILKEGQQGKDGSKYCLEGDPYTEILMHNRVKTTFVVHDPGTGDEYFEGRIPYYVPDSLVDRKDEIVCWFEENNNGLIKKYGHSQSAKLIIDKEVVCVNAWYIESVEDRYGSYVQYNYDNDDLNVSISSIDYGKRHNDQYKGINNRIVFNYENLGENATLFFIDDKQGKKDKKLVSVATYVNSNLCRTFKLRYKEESDACPQKKSRLVSVEEENAEGDKLYPLVFNWEYVPKFSLDSEPKFANYSVVDSSNNQVSQRHFYCADLTNDGLSDIVEMQVGSLDKAHFVRYYFSKSHLNEDGSITYEKMSNNTLNIYQSLIRSFSIEYQTIADFDGDGYNDYITAFRSEKKIEIIIIPGKSITENFSVNYTYELILDSNTEPIIEVSDIDEDGRDEIVFLETSKKNPWFHIVKYDLIKDFVQIDFQHKSSNKPIKLYADDFTNDGLKDLMVLDDYKCFVYRNSGGEFSKMFCQNNVQVIFSLCDHHMMDRGDFNGDGLIDFVYYKSHEHGLYMAINCGNGSFANERLNLENIDIYPKDNKIELLVTDFNRDGLTDVVVNYVQSNNKSVKVLWLTSTGKKLELEGVYDYTRNSPSETIGLFLADFDGDGYTEVANYEKDFITNSIKKNKINIFSLGKKEEAQVGRIINITDGMGNRIEVKYAFSTSMDVRSKEGYVHRWGYLRNVNSYMIPIPVVASVSEDRGRNERTITDYKYQDLLIDIQGRGVLGFNKVIRTNEALGTSSTTEVTEWNKEFYIPVEISTENCVGNKISTSIVRNAVTEKNGTYYSYIKETETVDLDGNSVSTLTSFDTDKGVTTQKIVVNEEGVMFKQVDYEYNWPSISGVFLPSKLTMTQKHRDDQNSFVSSTEYLYDKIGNLISQKENANSDLSLITEYKYDSYGNIISSISKGSEVIEIEEITEYDETGLRVKRVSTNPATAIVEYAYDEWGNIVMEKDLTNPSCPLVTTHTYDGWGQEVTVTDDLGLETRQTIGWYNSGDKKYFIRTTFKNAPEETIWYDQLGRELEKKTVGLLGVPVITTYSYNSQGLLKQETLQADSLKVEKAYEYDERGRLLREIHNDGKEIIYSYGNRTDTIRIGNRYQVNLYDEWGNITKNISSSGDCVEYEYHSNGEPMRIKSHGSVVTMQYDAVGNNISVNDPNVGIIAKKYAADGTLLSETDALGITTTYTYDHLGRLTSMTVGDNVVNYEYGDNGTGYMRLAKQTFGGHTISYEYDCYGRILKEHRTIEGNGMYDFEYHYNRLNQLDEMKCPGGLSVIYQYDVNGLLFQTIADGKVVYNSYSYNGLETKSSFMGRLITTNTRNKNGYYVSSSISKNGKEIERFSVNHDVLTHNLLSRQRNDNPQESFEYDDFDRLVAVHVGNTKSLSMNYAFNGNITSKSDLGDYEYQSGKPHAVTRVTKLKNQPPSLSLKTEFNEFGKVRHIDNSIQKLDVEYGPDGNRWVSKMVYAKDENTPIKTTIYAGIYEKIIEAGVAREFYYLDGNVVVLKQDGIFTPFLAFKDNLGSFLSLIDEKGNVVFDASYDVWGKQTININLIGFSRGYTGHEMLNEFGIINMNGRLYDPVLGRFFSPDSYIQSPFCGQNYNRYSYCLNNPLKYTDPSGNIYGIDDALFIFIAQSLMSMGHSMIMAKGMGQNVWKAAGVSLMSSLGTYGIGSACGAMASAGMSATCIGMVNATAHGLNCGLMSALEGGSFGRGFITGVASSGMASVAENAKMSPGAMLACTTAMGGAVAWVTGGDFLDGALRGMEIGAFNHLMHQAADGTTFYTDTDKAGRYSFGITISEPMKLSPSDAVGLTHSARTIRQIVGASKAARVAADKTWNGGKIGNYKYGIPDRAKYKFAHYIRKQGSTKLVGEISQGAKKTGKAARWLKRAGFMACTYDNAIYIFENRRFGLGNCVDLAVSGISVMVPGVGTVVSLSYLGIDYAYSYYHDGQSLRDALNDCYSIGKKKE